MDFNDQRNQYILNYLENDKTNTALLLKGSWGTGKTYYIKQSLIPFLENKGKKVVFVSLYGIKDTGELSKYIFTESYFKTSNSKAGIVGIGIAKTVIRGVTSHFNVELNGGSKEWKKLSKYANLKNKLLIIDDLERHDESFGVAEILGYINNLCENDGVKVLLIGDENTLFGASCKKEFEEQIKLNKPQNKYKKIKEKTIGDTLEFISNFEDAIRNILHSFKLPFIDDKNESNIINEVVDISNLKEINSKNLRTVSRACQKMNDMLNEYHSIFELIEKEKVCSTFFQSVFLGLVGFYFRLSLDSSLKYDLSDGLVSSKLGTNKYPLYWFSYDFFATQSLQEVDFTKAFAFFRTSVQQNVNNGLFDLITSYYRVTESQLTDALNKLKECLKNNTVKLDSYSSLATYLIAIEHQVGLTDEVKEILSLMKENIRNSDIDLERAIELKNFVSGCKLETKEEQDEYDSLVNTFIEVSETKTKEKTKSIKKESLKEILKEADKNADKWMATKKGYSNFIDFDQLVEFMKSEEATALEVDEINSAFLRFYSRISNIYEFCRADLEALRRMKKELENIQAEESFDKTKRMQIRWFVGNLKHAIEKLEQGGRC